jgi:hypothetical protein
MLGSDAARCALTAVFAVLAAGQISSPAALAPVAAVLGGCSALFMPASAVLMPTLLDAGRLPTANAVYTGSVQFGMLESARGDGRAAASVWSLLRQARILQIILAVSVMANFALIGTTEVALPALAHARFGADGYGAVLTCVALGSLAGAIIVARIGRRARPSVLLGAAFLVAAVAINLAPFLGGLRGGRDAGLRCGSRGRQRARDHGARSPALCLPSPCLAASHSASSASSARRCGLRLSPRMRPPANRRRRTVRV